MFLQFGITTAAARAQPSADPSFTRDWKRTIDTDLIQFEVSEHRLGIPKNYLYNKTLWKGGKTKGITLDALYPEMAPYSEVTRKDFERPGNTNMILLLLHDRDKHLTVQEAYSVSRKSNRFEEVDSTDISRIGLRRLADPYPKGREMYVRDVNGSVTYYAICSKDKAVRFPRCKTFFDYSDGMYVEYSFSKSLLSEWQSLDKRVRSLVQSFEKNR